MPLQVWDRHPGKGQFCRIYLGKSNDNEKKKDEIVMMSIGHEGQTLEAIASEHIHFQ